MKGKYSFTIEDRLMSWFRLYVKEESTTMSATLNQHILSLKNQVFLIPIHLLRYHNH